MSLVVQDRQVGFKPVGVKGGVGNRTSEFSPQKPKGDGQAVIPKARQLERPKAVPRKEEDDFHPIGCFASELENRGEEELDSLVGQNPWNEATEYFIDSANAYNANGEYIEAGNAFIRAVDCLLKMNKKLEAAQLLVKAAESYSNVKDGVETAIESLSEVIDIYEEYKRPRNVARLYRIGARLFESVGNYKDAEDWCMQSAVLYSKLNDIVNQYTCLLQCAELQFRSENFDLASQLYERVAELTLNDYLTGRPHLPRLEAPQFFFKSVVALACKADFCDKGLDRLALLETAQFRFLKYTDIDLEHFNTGLEHETCKRFLDAVIKQDVRKLEDAFADYYSSRKPSEEIQSIINNRIVGSLVRWLAKVADMYGMR